MELEAITLRADDGRSVDLGDREHFLAATREMSDWTGGSSALGRWSYLWGYVVAARPTGEAIESEVLDKIAEEAADFLAVAERDLSDQACAVLGRLADVGSHGEP
jgi:hypothetical protein